MSTPVISAVRRNVKNLLAVFPSLLFPVPYCGISMFNPNSM